MHFPSCSPRSSVRRLQKLQRGWETRNVFPIVSVFDDKVNKQLVAPHDRREPRTRARDEAEEDSVRAWRSRSIDGRVRARARVEVRVGVVVRARVRASVRIRSVRARPPGHGQLHLMRVRVRVG